MNDEPLFSPRRLFNAARLWLYFVRKSEYRHTLWQYVRYYRRREAAKRDGVEFL